VTPTPSAVSASADLLALARTLPIPVPWDRNVFIGNIAAMRGRPIRLVPTDTASLNDSPCGLWLKREHDDVILHERGTSDYHIDQIICHEIGHMILGHDRPSQPDEQPQPGDATTHLLRAILPDLHPDAIRAVLGRHDYATGQERDAEMMASMIMLAAKDQAATTSVVRSVFFGRR